MDNPDQRINDDVAAFTTAALAFTLVLFNSAIDLVSFSGILYSIYPPLFAALLIYAVGCVPAGSSTPTGAQLFGVAPQHEG